MYMYNLLSINMFKLKGKSSKLHGYYDLFTPKNLAYRLTKQNVRCGSPSNCDIFQNAIGRVTMSYDTELFYTDKRQTISDLPKTKYDLEPNTRIFFRSIKLLFVSYKFVNSFLAITFLLFLISS